MKRIFAFVLSFALLSVLPSFAIAAEGKASPACNDDQIIIASGLSSGTYSKMTKDFVKVNPELLCEDTSSTGGPINVDLLLGNKVDAGMVQADVLDFLSRTEPKVKKQLRSLAALHTNVLHIIVKRSGVSFKEKGFFKKEKRFVFKNLRELRAQSVVGFASGFHTGFMINERLTLGMNLRNADLKDEAFKMLNDGQVVAIFAMGGNPIDWVEKLDGNVYSLITIDPGDIAFLGQPYSPTKLTYRNLGVMGLNTIAVRNDLVVRNATGKQAQRLLTLRNLLKDNLEEIKNTRGSHSSWQDIEEVKSLDDVYWQKFEPAGVAAKKVAKKK